MEEIINLIRHNIPIMRADQIKGSMGRIGVIGGSNEYTGAPYFAGISALYCGADIVHVISAAAAAPAIKCYSPELIVHPVLDNNLKESLRWLPRLHSIVVGPGLGMSENVPNTIEIVRAFRQTNKPLIIDADGLYIVSTHKELFQGDQKTILTPNVNEFSRLYKSVLGRDPSGDPQETSDLAAALGNLTIVRKGPADVISDGHSLIICNSDGSPRRCGGQGDLLSGMAAVFTHWLHENNFTTPCSASVAAGVAACVLTRKCASQAFGKFRRSTHTMKMIDEIQTAFEELFTSTSK